MSEQRFICDDVLSGLDSIDDKSVHLIVTSPPYFNAKNYDNFERWEAYDDYLNWCRIWMKMCSQKLKEGRMFSIVISPIIVPRKKRSERSKRYNIPADLHSIFSDMGFWFVEDITWVKPEGAAINRNQRFSIDRHPLQWKANPVTESILVYQKPTNKLNGHIIQEYNGKDRIKGKFVRSDVWRINPDTQSDHPAPFPIEIPYRLVKYYTWSDDLILDPFVGSGNSALAAKQLNRNFIGIDKSENYISMSQDRVKNHIVPTNKGWW